MAILYLGSWDSCTPVKCCFSCFLLGVTLPLISELVLLLYIFAKPWKYRSKYEGVSQVGIDTQGDSISFSLQGNVWVAPLETGDWSNVKLKHVGKEKKKNKDSQRECGLKDSIEILPLLHHANLGDKVLHLKASDGAEDTISLDGCQVFAVSGGPGPKQKWAKKCPIQVYHENRSIYRGCKTCLLYLETSWEKEAWCEVLRATAKMGSTSNNEYLKTKREYADYTQDVEKYKPYVTEFHTNKGTNHFDIRQHAKKSDKNRSPDDGLSRKRVIWNKLTRRGSRGKVNLNPLGAKSTDASNAYHHARKQLQPSSSYQQEDRNSKEKVVGSTSEVDANDVPWLLPASGNLNSATRPINLGSGIHEREGRNTFDSGEEDSVVTVVNAADDEKPSKTGVAKQPDGEQSVVSPEKDIEPGLICFNMVVARLYFDFYHCPDRIASIQRVLQRQLSKLRTPSYIKSVTITKLDLGKSPPFVTAMHMLPADKGGAMGVEMDMVWQSGGYVTIETGVDMRDSNAQEKMAAHAEEPGLAGAAAMALLTGLEEDYTIPQAAGVSAAAMMEARQRNASEEGGGGGRKGRWLQSVKSLMSHVADHIAQVPIVLKVKCVSIKGKGLMRLRAPPTDCIWFAFKEMPDLNLVPEPSIGDRRINSGALNAFLVQHLQEQWRESLVLPNCQSVSVRWMKGDNDDWLPNSTIPFAFAPAPNLEAEKKNSTKNNGSDKPYTDTPSRTPLQTTITRPSSDGHLLPKSRGPQVLQADVIDKVVFSEGELSVSSATESDIGASDASVEFAQHESDGSLSNVDLQSTAIHNPERSLDQQPHHQAKHSKAAFVGKIGMRLDEKRHRLDEKRHRVIDKLRERKAMEGSDRSTHSS